MTPIEVHNVEPVMPLGVHNLEPVTPIEVRNVEPLTPIEDRTAQAFELWKRFKAFQKKKLQFQHISHDQ